MLETTDLSDPTNLGLCVSVAMNLPRRPACIYTVSLPPFFHSLPAIMLIKTPLPLILLAPFFACISRAVPPPVTPNSPLFLLPKSDQTCIMASCPSPYQAGAHFCRSLNNGCLFCAPHPRSIGPLVTFACVGHWMGPLELEAEDGYLRLTNSSGNTSTLLSHSARQSE